MAYTPVVEIDQLGQRFDLMVFPLVIEPTRSDGDIAFATQPHTLVFISPDTSLKIGEFRFRRINTPLGVAGPTFLVPNPSDVGYSTSKDHGVRMFFLDLFTSSLVIIIGFRVDGSFFVSAAIPAITTVSAIKPIFEKRAVITDQLLYLGVIFFYVSGCTVIIAVSVPRGEVNTKLQAVAFAGLREFTYHITLAIFPRGVLDTVFRGGRWP